MMDGPNERRVRDEESFDRWMHRVDEIVKLKAGVSVHDLPDWNSYDAWASGTSPSDGAREALEAADFPMDQF